jgi:hypothetical protein
MYSQKKPMIAREKSFDQKNIIWEQVQSVHQFFG